MSCGTVVASNELEAAAEEQTKDDNGGILRRLDVGEDVDSCTFGSEREQEDRREKEKQKKSEQNKSGTARGQLTGNGNDS